MACAALGRVWDLQTGRCVHVLAGHTGRLNRVRVAPSAPIAVTVADDFTARVWDWPAGRCLHVLAGTPRTPVSLCVPQSCTAEAKCLDRSKLMLPWRILGRYTCGLFAGQFPCMSASIHWAVRAKRVLTCG